MLNKLMKSKIFRGTVNTTDNQVTAQVKAETNSKAKLLPYSCGFAEGASKTNVASNKYA